MMNTQISLADNPPLWLIQTRCVHLFHVSELRFLPPHHGKMLETCVLISNSLEFWPVGGLRPRRSSRIHAGLAFPSVPYLLCVSAIRPVGSHIPPPPGARHQLEAIRFPIPPPELFLEAAASGWKTVVGRRAHRCQSADEASRPLAVLGDSGRDAAQIAGRVPLLKIRRLIF